MGDVCWLCGIEAPRHVWNCENRFGSMPPPVGWRARALAAEARLGEVDQIIVDERISHRDEAKRFKAKLAEAKAEVARLRTENTALLEDNATLHQSQAELRTYRRLTEPQLATLRAAAEALLKARYANMDRITTEILALERALDGT